MRTKTARRTVFTSCNTRERPEALEVCGTVADDSCFRYSNLHCLLSVCGSEPDCSKGVSKRALRSCSPGTLCLSTLLPIPQRAAVTNDAPPILAVDCVAECCPLYAQFKAMARSRIEAKAVHAIRSAEQCGPTAQNDPNIRQRSHNAKLIVSDSNE